ncbi:MAG: PEP-CTERM sorting domain-containing protein, partial [Thermoguttaceae bacterium]
LPDGGSLTVGAGSTLIFDPSVPVAAAIVSPATSPTAVPEPGTLALLYVGAIGLLGCAWRRWLQVLTISRKESGPNLGYPDSLGVG